jgi:hypothetical protein
MMTPRLQARPFVLGRQAIVDMPAILIGVLTLLVLVSVRKIPEPASIPATGVVGLLFNG